MPYKIMRFDSSFMESNHKDVRNGSRSYWQRDFIFSNIVPRNNYLFFCRWGKIPVLETEDVFFTVRCQYGWEYDRTWYSQTAASQEGWVCSRELQIPNTLFFCKVGEVLGEVFIGQLGDTWVQQVYATTLAEWFANVSGQTETKLTNVTNWQQRYM